MILESSEDQSVNFVEESGQGKVECRYVRRSPDKINCYLSSQTGCKQACRFCFLTQTGQTKDENVTPEGFKEQAETVLNYYTSLGGPRAWKVHYDFMARGDVFANTDFIQNARRVLRGLSDSAESRALVPQFKLSTILPKGTESLDLSSIFGEFNPDIYYSLYSLDPAFRQHWMPKASDPRIAFKVLKEWQKQSHKIIFLHWAYIKDQNDSEENIDSICDLVNEFGLRVNFNVVRYNPFSSKFGEESDMGRVEELLARLGDQLPESRIKVVSRVGFDVKASCGMFVA